MQVCGFAMQNTSILNTTVSFLLQSRVISAKRQIWTIFVNIFLISPLQIVGVRSYCLVQNIKLWNIIEWQVIFCEHYGGCYYFENVKVSLLAPISLKNFSLDVEPCLKRLRCFLEDKFNMFFKSLGAIVSWNLFLL